MSAKQGKGTNVFAAKGKIIAEQEAQRKERLQHTSRKTEQTATVPESEAAPADTNHQAEDLPGYRTSPKAASGSTKGLQEGWTRFTVTTKTDLVEDMKVYAFRNRQTLKSVVTQAFAQFLKDKEIGVR